MIFNSPLVSSGSPSTFFNHQHQYSPPPQPFFQNSALYKSTKQKFIGFLLNFLKRKEKKQRNLSNKATKPILRALAGIQKASPQNDITFFKVNFNVTKNKTLFTYKIVELLQIH